MSRRRYRIRLFPVFAALVALMVVCGVSPASERCDIVYVNRFGEEILSIRVKYSTPYDEPRYDSSYVYLAEGQEYRLGIQGVLLPEMIIVDFATKSFVFDDLSGLNPENSMTLAIAHEEGRPLLRRLDSEGVAKGEERAYLTVANRPNAVDKDYVMDVTTLGELEELVRDQMEDAQKKQGELESFDLEAGPIWNQAHAEERCPEVAREWSEANDREARWTGQWTTTVPGEMSVCGCVAGTADDDGTVISEDDGWGATAYFPVFWKEWYGIGVLPEPEDRDSAFPIAMRFRLPKEGKAEMLDELLADLRVDGFRPGMFTLELSEKDADGDWSAREIEVDFFQEKGDVYDAHDSIMEALTSAYAGKLRKGGLVWVDGEAFEEAKKGGETGAVRGVICAFSQETFQAVFMPDVGFLLNFQESDEPGDAAGTEQK